MTHETHLIRELLDHLYEARHEEFEKTARNSIVYGDFVKITWSKDKLKIQNVSRKKTLKT